jgi:DNA-binding NtrC family response regulator
MGEKIKILLADRNHNIRELLRREFEAGGYQVETAGDGREVLMMIRSDESPALLVLDLDLPMVYELNLLEKIQDHTPPLPVIIHYSHRELSEHPDDFTADAFIEKDGSIDQLKNAVDEVIQRYYARDTALSKKRDKKKRSELLEDMPEAGSSKK